MAYKLISVLARTIYSFFASNQHDCRPSRAQEISSSDHHHICDMSTFTSMDQSDQRVVQASKSHQISSVTTSTVTATGTSRQSPCARDKSHKSADRDQTSTVIGSRIEKKRTNRCTSNAISHAKTTTASEILIRVFINNRLGTKTEIPCSPTDTIGEFKRVAAVYLGTNPEAMMLKRQGERTFKDFLTLDDYEIRDGSSLDLEIDTCDI